MKKVFSLISVLLLAGTIAFGQDARGRVPVTVVNDVLAAMPAKDAKAMKNNAADLAKSAPQTVSILAERLAPGADNSLVEYAISGVVAYVSDVTGESYKDAVREGLRQGIQAQKDPVQRNFLLQQLRLIATDEDTTFFEGYVNDTESAATAVAALIDLPSGADAISRLVALDAAPKALLADAVAEKGIKSAEPKLLEWAATASGADKDAINHALGVIGSSASAGYLMANSKADYAALLANLPQKEAVAAAKALIKEGESDVKCAAVKSLMAQSVQKDGLKVLSSAFKTTDRPYRNAALEAATACYGADAVAAQVKKDFYKVDIPAQTDIVNWLGANKVPEMDIITGAMNVGGELGDAGVRAAGQVGGPVALEALIDKLGTKKAPQAMKALLSFEDDMNAAVAAALTGPKNTAQKYNLMTLAGLKGLKAATPAVLEEAGKGSAPAIKALAGVVGPEDVDAVAAVLEKAETESVPDAQKALLSALHTQAPDVQVAKIKELMAKSPTRSRYYPVLASVGTDEAVNVLRGLASQEPDAKEALLSMDNAAIIPDLAEIAKGKGAQAEKALDKYIGLLATKEQNPDAKRQGLANALNLAKKNNALKVKALNALGDVSTMKAFLLAGKSLDDANAEVRLAAANAVKKIASKTTEEINYDDLKKNLEKAAVIYQARGWADDGYAIDEINKMLLEAKPSPKSELTEEEKKEGFVMLFDGTDLKNWHGDMEGYTVVNGSIYVSADYGSTGNLYTNKQYRNFVYRFEFCFLQEGVNNGVGIRTPENVDAAYNGMCEVQILDHDAKMYADLRDYQVHGSVYGVVPAKRIKHKPLGQWSTEEIYVEGDRIKVTVNGQVIVDADVREVTKGHNVDPDGGKTNPYTVDGNNHPGMFNYKGFISFCGHGAGLKIRNVRIKDLGYKK